LNTSWLVTYAVTGPFDLFSMVIIDRPAGLSWVVVIPVRWVVGWVVVAV